jgi:hypothetical protein
VGQLKNSLKPSDITKSELQQRPERSLPSDPHRLVGEPLEGRAEEVPPGAERRGEDVGVRPLEQPGRRELGRGERTVQPELGRVQGPLERKLSPEQKRAFAPKVEARRESDSDSTPASGWATWPRYAGATSIWHEANSASSPPRPVGE